MSTAHVLVEPHGGVAVLRLHRRLANAFCLELARDCFSALASDAAAQTRPAVASGSER